MFELRVLGSLDLQGPEGGEVLSVLAQPKRVCFLAYLALKHPQVCGREELQKFFWPDLSPERARAAVRKSLHFLRQSLGEETILTPGQDEVAVDGERLRCDAVAFREAVTKGDEEEALTLYRGNLLEGVSLPECTRFEHWLAEERERLREKAAAAAWTLAGRHVREGRFEDADRAGQRALEIAKTAEGPVLALVQSLAEAGKPEVAVRFFGRFAQGLRRETGEDPSAEAKGLVEEIEASGQAVLTVASPPVDLTERKGRRLAFPLPRRMADLSPVPVPLSQRRLAAAGWFVAAAFALVAGWALWAVTERDPPRPIQFTLLPGGSLVPNSWEAPPGVELALSPDGSELLFVGPSDEGWQLWYDDLEDEELELEAIRLPHSAYNPVFSPDGQSLAYETDGGIHIVSVSGGAPTALASVENGEPIASSDPSSVPRMPAWGDDGMIYFALKGIIYRTSAMNGRGGGDMEGGPFTTETEGARHLHPSALPDGRGVLVTIVRDSAEQSTIGVVGQYGGRVKDLELPCAMARYATSGHLVYTTSDGILWSVPFDLGDLDVKGPPQPEQEPVHVKADLASQFTLSKSGHLLFRTGPFLPTVPSLVWVAPDGSMEPVDSIQVGPVGGPKLSPDQTRIAFSSRDESRTSQVWMMDPAGGPPLQLTRGPSENWDPEWSSDGLWITFISDRVGEGDVWRSRVDGQGQPELVYDGPRAITNHTWSRGDEWLVYTEESDELDDGIRAVRPGDDSATRTIAGTEAREVSPAISPDGRWVAFVSMETGEHAVHVVRFPNPGGERWTWPSARSGVPTWSRDGRQMFFWRGADPSDTRSPDELVAVEVDLERGLFQADPIPVLPGISSDDVDSSFDVVDDDSMFLMVRRGDLVGEMVLWQNFIEVLREQGKE
jgi:DNA-binding SARP family transcriptional activator/Tol biopolymer transport system component